MDKFFGKTISIPELEKQNLKSEILYFKKKFLDLQKKV